MKMSNKYDNALQLDKRREPEKQKSISDTEQGFCMVVMAFSMMMLGALLLTSFDRLVNSWQKSMITERVFYLQFNQASSSLSLAKSLNWQSANYAWQCQQDTVNQFKVCAKKSRLTADDYVLVRGEYTDFYLYALAHQNGQKLDFEQGHWLDYCPEKKSSDCE